MKIPQCYFKMKLCLVSLFISVKLNHAKERTYQLFHLCTCFSSTEKCHLVEMAYQKETIIK